MIKKYSPFHYRTDFILKKNMLVVETDEKGHVDRDSDYERKIEKELEKLAYNLIRTNPNKIVFSDYEEFGRVCAYIAESMKNQLKNLWVMIFQEDC